MSILSEYVQDNGYTITKKPQRNVWITDCGLVLKQTKRKYEISVAKKLEGVENDLWAKVIDVKNFGATKIIIIEEVEPLTKHLSTQVSIFTLKLVLAFLISLFILILTFGYVKINLKDMFFFKNDKDREIINFIIEVREECRKRGINEPSDYIRLTNLGVKNGKLICFDIRNQKDYMTDFIW